MSAATAPAWLGDPFDDGNPAGFAQAARRRRDGIAPDELIAAARRRGLALAYTPARWGGALADPVGSGRLVRQVVSRDLDAMTALLMHLTPMLVTGLLGSDDQRDRLVGRIAAGEDIGYALSEEEHGSDLLAMRTAVEQAGDGWVLTGRKWFVGLAPTAAAFVVIARSGGRGPAAFSAYEVPADAPGVRIGAERPTDGFRGTRFADVEFDHVRLPGSALIGPAGAALEGVLRAQTVVRALSLPGAMAGADADRLLLGAFAQERRGGATLGADPLFRADVGQVAGAMLLAEAATEAALRTLGTRSSVAVLPAALAKHTVVEALTTAHGGIGRLLASRGVLVDGHWGMHTKVVADSRVIGSIDGSAVATLRAVAAFLPRCARASREPGRPGRSGPAEPVAADPAPSDFDPAAVAVVPAPVDPALEGFLALGRSALTVPGAERVERLRAALAAHGEEAARIDQVPRAERPVVLVEFARRHAWLSSAAAAVIDAVDGRCGPLARAFGPHWLDAALDHALSRVGAAGAAGPVERMRWGSALLDSSTRGDDEGAIDGD